MKLLDLFCGAGGAAQGYFQAGFDEIIGIDLHPQPHYPFTFIQGNALYPPVRLSDFDLIHASPPCQAYSRGSVGPRQDGKSYPQLVEPTMAMLEPYPHVIENVPGSPLRPDLVLCGSMMSPPLSAWDPDLGKTVYLKRHRVFQSSFPLWQPPDFCHMWRDRIAGVYSGGGEARNKALRGESRRGGYTPRTSVRLELMQMPWATQREVNEAIPPAYTAFIGREILNPEWWESSGQPGDGPSAPATAPETAKTSESLSR